MTIKYPQITLSEPQRRIVEHMDGPLLVSAGPGSGKCLTGDAMIATSEGMLRIEDCEHINDAACLDLDKFCPSTSHDAKWYDMGMKHTIKICTDSGIELSGTPEHPLLVWDGDFTWKRLDSIQHGDHVLLYPGHSYYQETTELNYCEIAYLLGLLIGDAYTNRRSYTIGFSRGGEFLPPVYYRLAKKWLGKEPRKYTKSGSESVTHQINSQEAWEWLEHYGYPLGCRAGDKYIPSWVLRSGTDIQSWFLRGYFDTDGSVSPVRHVELVSASETLARQTQQLLIGLGIVPILREKHVDGYEQTYWRLSISGDQARTFKDRVGFKHELNKAAKLEQLTSKKSNPNKGTYPHTDMLLYKMKSEWKSTNCWDGRKQEFVCEDGCRIGVKRYLHGTRTPSQQTLHALCDGYTSTEARKLQLLTQLYPDKIVSVEAGPVAHVYDLTIPTHHNFVANGIVSHNTRVIVERIAHMLSEGVRPESVLATTFTRKAADEMNERLQAKGIDISRMAIQTMHALCWRMIRAHKTFKGWRVDDKDVSRIVLKNVIGYKQMNWTGCDISQVGTFISAARNSLVAPENSAGFLAPMFRDQRYSQAYKLYSDQMEERRLMTFDDMLYYGVWLLENDPRQLDRMQGKYLYVMVDEFQDSNFAQLRLAELIATPEFNYMAVGDIDQAIYSWRGALPEFMLEFSEKYGAEIVELGINYRCAPAIMQAAANCIVNNENRFSKDLTAHNKDEATIKFLQATDTDEEAQMVLEEILAIHEDGVGYGNIRVLMRTNAQSRAIEEAFIDGGIPFVVLGAVSFYERKEIADLMSYLRVLYDPRDVKAGERALNRPFRYVSRKIMDRISARVEYNYVDAATYVLDQTNLHSAKEWCNLMCEFDVESDSPADVLRRVVEDTDYIDYLTDAEGTDTPETSRAGNVVELIASATRFKTIPEFVEYVDKQIKLRKRNQRKNDDSRVQVMTIHKSKGTEAYAVFMIGMNEGIIPHAKGDEEEERRLAYVGMTRSKRLLFLTSVSGQDMAGAMSNTRPSRFVYEAGIISDENLTAPLEDDMVESLFEGISDAHTKNIPSKPVESVHRRDDS